MRAGLQGTLTRVWARIGTRPPAPRQTEYEWGYVFGAICPATGEMSGLVLPEVNTASMNLFLDTLSEQVGEDRHAVVVLDQAGWHQSQSLQVPGNLTFVFLPPYSPELNAVERVWEEFRERLSNWVYKNYEELVDALCHIWNHYRENPEAIQSLGRNFCLNSHS